MSAAIAALAASYGSGSGSESDSDSEGSRCPLPAADSLMHLTKSPSAKPSLAVAVDSAPEVAVKVSVLASAPNPLVAFWVLGYLFVLRDELLTFRSCLLPTCVFLGRS